MVVYGGGVCCKCQCVGEMYVRVCGWGRGVLSIVWWWCIDGGVWWWYMVVVYHGGVSWCMVVYGDGVWWWWNVKT